MHIADRSLFLAMARSLWAFDFEQAVDAQTGKKIVPDANDLAEGLFICPRPFQANIVPRSDKKASRVKEEWAQVQELLDENMQWKKAPEGLKWGDHELDTEGMLDG
jgi:hypothetical protein